MHEMAMNRHAGGARQQQQLELRLWESHGHELVRPVARRLTVQETLAALEPVLGRLDRHTVYDLVRAGRLDSVQPGAVLRGKEARNHAHRICPRSLERLLASLSGQKAVATER